jgi:transposase
VLSFILASDYLACEDRICATIQLKMAQIKSWIVSDALWRRVELLVPARKRPHGSKYQRKPGGGRKPMPARQVFSAIVYVLRTGCRWKALPKEYGSASAVHAHFQRWQREGFFVKIWKAGLAEHDEMEGIAWHWQSIDGATGKAPPALECVGPSSMDRGEKWALARPLVRRAWHPVVARRQRGKAHLFTDKL